MSVLSERLLGLSHKFTMIAWHDRADYHIAMPRSDPFGAYGKVRDHE
jgi:hypothetical protein